MRMKNVLITVNDVYKAREFYRSIFGLGTVLEREGNIVMTEGLVLQERKVLEKYFDKEIISYNNASLIYFEENNIEAFAEKLERLYPQIEYVKKLTTLDWGQKMICFYDLDGNLIEVRNGGN